VTKCDQLFGLEEWTHHLSEEAVAQSMGYLSEDKDENPTINNFLNEAFAKIGDKLKKLRIALVARSNHISPELLLFPREFEQLKPGLHMFTNACLGENPYLELPFLRGLFFSSGYQEGGVSSSVLGDLIPPVPLHQGTNAGIFLHDFFGRILPQDRHISQPAALVNHWNRVTQNLGLLTWLFLVTAVGLLMSISFVYNLNTINLIRVNHPYTADYVGSLEPDSLTLERVRDSISLVEKRNDNWKNKWMMPNSSISKLEVKLKQMYNEQYAKFIFPTVNANVEENLNLSIKDDISSRFPQMILSKIYAINIYLARQKGANLATLEALPQRVLSLDGYSQELGNRLNKLFVTHVAWLPSSDPIIEAGLQSAQDVVQHYAFIDPNLSWLTRLESSSIKAKEVTVNDFWGLSSKLNVQNSSFRVAPAYTQAGKREIDNFLLHMENAIENGSEFVRYKRAFEAWYHLQHLLEWQQFVTAFPSGESVLSGEVAWRSKLGDAVSKHSPYYLLIDRLNEEFKDEPETGLPGWILLAREFSALLEHAQNKKVGTGVVNRAAKFLDVINLFGGTAIRDSVSDDFNSADQIIKNNLNAITDLDNFLVTLNQIATNVSVGSSKAYKESADFHTFSTNPESKSPPPIYDAAAQLKLLHQHLQHNNVEDELVWRLIEGPFHYVVSYTEEQSSCNLQQIWESDVLWPLKTATTKAEFVDQLYGEKGTVWAFVDGPAKPFLTRDANQFSVVTTMGYSLPFSNAFLPMLNGAVGKRVDQLMAQKRVTVERHNDELLLQKEKLQNQQAQAEIDRIIADLKQKISGIKNSKFPLTITAQPTSVNPSAKEKPFAVVLTIQCAAGERRLVNLNFPVSDNFDWDFGSCGDVDLRIRLDSFTLTKKYPGAWGVVHFLRDFKSGHRQFNAIDFPESQLKLSGSNITQIGVNFNFGGQDTILKTAEQLEQLEESERTKMLEKQRLQDQKFNTENQEISAKMSVSSKMSLDEMTVIEIPVLKEIGACWNSSVPMQDKNTVESYFKNLVNQKLD
jgi:type VI secretion system protein ImpL